MEDVQRRAVQIIAKNIPYADACESMGISSWLTDVPIYEVNFLHVSLDSNDEHHALHYLLPTKRDTALINQLCSANVFLPVHVWTYIIIIHHHVLQAVLSRSLLLNLAAIRSTILYLFLCVNGT